MATYASELAFAARTGCDLRSTFLLAVQTVRFHWHNAGRAVARGDEEFAVKVRLGQSDVRLTLRPYAGDLFVFYEVLLHDCYTIPKALYDPASVRTIVDCGANIGLTALYFAERYPGARILAIEPHPENFRLLCSNTESQRRITPIRACLARDLKKRFLSVDKPAWGNQMNERAEGIEVPAATVESICRDYGVDTIDILKMDIEGAEKEVFSECEFLPRVGIVVIELHGGYSLECFNRDIGQWGFTARPPNPCLGTKMITAFPAGKAPGSNGNVN